VGTERGGSLAGEEAAAQLRAELRADQRTEDLAESMDRVEEEVQAWWTVVHLPWFTDHSPSLRTSVLFVSKDSRRLDHSSSSLQPNPG
jgi:hypothetical protein